jgi:anti-sigma-K factor RskA
VEVFSGIRGAGTFGVSHEKAGGSTTNAPTQPLVVSFAL